MNTQTQEVIWTVAPQTSDTTHNRTEDAARQLELTTEKLLQGKNEHYEEAIKLAEQNITNAQAVKKAEAFVMGQLKKQEEAIKTVDTSLGIKQDEQLVEEHKYRTTITRLGELFVYENYLPKPLRQWVLDETNLDESVQEAFSYDSVRDLVKDKPVKTDKATINPYILTKQRIEELRVSLQDPNVCAQLLDQIDISRKRLHSTTSEGANGLTAEETANYALFLLAAEKAIHREQVNDPDAIIINTQPIETNNDAQTTKQKMSLHIDQEKRKQAVEEIDKDPFFQALKAKTAKLRVENEEKDAVKAQQNKTPENPGEDDMAAKIRAMKERMNKPKEPTPST